MTEARLTGATSTPTAPADTCPAVVSPVGHAAGRSAGTAKYGAVNGIAVPECRAAIGVIIWFFISGYPLSVSVRVTRASARV
jgi:hypothetical protein